MRALKIDATDFAPKIYFEPDQYLFEISGHSRPEDVRDFYYPVLNWLDMFMVEVDDYKAKFEEKALRVKFKLSYFNSSSAKFLLDILVELKKIVDLGISMKIEWHFEDGDDDMQEVGEEFSEMVDIPFSYVIYSE